MCRYTTASDAVVVHVPAGARLASPLHIVQLSTAGGADGGLATSAPRVVVVVGEGAEASIVEEFAFAHPTAPGADAAAYWHNGVCEMVLEKGAKVGLYKL